MNGSQSTVLKDGFKKQVRGVWLMVEGGGPESGEVEDGGDATPLLARQVKGEYFT